MSYLGSKAASGVYQKIIAEMPPHDTYIETHLGSGAVLFHKPPALRNYGADLDDTARIKTLQRWKDRGINPPRLDFFHGDAVYFLESLKRNGAITGVPAFAKLGRVLVYCDPPYMLETRTSRARYRHDYTVADHERLLACLINLPENVSVILSGYPSQLYDDRLTGWRSKEFQAMTRGGVRTEKIWMNYPEGRAYTHTFAGKDYNDRHRIKRKVERWRAKYAALPPAERLAIMVALNEVDAGQ
ncbi:DNA adenine methylase [Salmonella enterica]|uniref:site-specific DNA-methyltransferase (adenine-specific) n=1 Tax=Salmonella enterica TaxID=28901 RepID=A0A5V3BV22_SALER|nr:DNA adenine methylase [Salmonella enterica]EBP3303891.1 DNA adenine methylase [Salmonella enterica subsp. enterica]EBV5329967.1 DNA adenine methylase [Salmonella enterica subsp. enterica serovar Braenderup]ECT9504627.1 DNA adenine methylase [Salmonella enterica subsp. enterica serovar Eastbourne]EDI2364106.1 DNA adenine methylase [Salmonella enterica subsp. enterica serovar Poona]